MEDLEESYISWKNTKTWGYHFYKGIEKMYFLFSSEYRPENPEENPYDDNYFWGMGFAIWSGLMATVANPKYLYIPAATNVASIFMKKFRNFKAEDLF